MSIGNLKDQGNKGNNFPYQLRNLQLLGDINQGIIDLNSTAILDLAGPMTLDAFGRQRVSETFTLGDYKNLYALDSNMFNSTSGTGTVTYQLSASCARLQVTASGAGTAIRQSKMYHPYMPGKSQLIYLTFNMRLPQPDVTKRIGYFDADNGVYFKQADGPGNGLLSFVVRSALSGENTVNQANWNVDKCDGTGASGFNLNVQNTQILFIDFQWLGVGTVRLGFVHEGKYIVAHEFQHDNLLPFVYMTSPNLPVRYELVSTGTSLASMDQICATVLSEGGYLESGQDWSFYNTGLTNLNSGATAVPFAIKLKNTFGSATTNRMIVKLDQYSVLSTKEPLSVELVKLPNVASLTTASLWSNLGADSGVEYNTGATAIANEEYLSTGYVAASAAGKESVIANASPSTAKKNYIVQNITSTDSEIYAIRVKNLGTTTTQIGVSMQWREIY